MSVTTYPPGPSGAPLVGNLLEFRRDPLGMMLKTARDFGDIATLKLGPNLIFLISNPEWIKDLLVTNHQSVKKSRGLERAKIFLGEGLATSEGELHRRQRRMAQPAFNHQRVAGYAETMANRASETSDHWSEGETRDIAEEMMRLTMVISGKTFFGSEVDSVSEEVGKQMAVIEESYFRRLMPYSELLDGLPLPSNRRLNRAIKRLDEIMHTIIEEHRKNGEDQGDLLSTLLMAHDEEGSGMSDKQLRDETVSLFFGGHETTSAALSWTWYLLSQNPEAESKFHKEVDSVLEGRLPQFEDFPKLTYTSMVFAESMRLYPPAWVLGRKLLVDYEVGSYTLPKGCGTFVSPWVMHHDSRYFPEPFEFDPMRWTPEAKASRPKFSYFPFGGGPRGCMGEEFAWMEGVILLATIGQRWRFKLSPGHQVEPAPMLTLRMKHGLRMILEKRRTQEATQVASRSA